MSAFNFNFDFPKFDKSDSSKENANLSNSRADTLFASSDIELEMREVFGEIESVPDISSGFSLESILDNLQPVEDNGLNFFTNDSEKMFKQDVSNLFEPDNDYYSNPE